MAVRGARRRQTWSAPVSWREARVLEVARAVASARRGPLSRADWLLALAEPLLTHGTADPALPAHLRQEAERAPVGLPTERAELTAHPARPGRPPAL